MRNDPPFANEQPIYVWIPQPLQRAFLELLVVSNVYKTNEKEDLQDRLHHLGVLQCVITSVAPSHICA